jgi:hypothetical protein
VLVQTDTAASTSSVSSHAALYVVLGLTVLVVAGALIGVRVMANRAGSEVA